MVFLLFDPSILMHLSFIAAPLFVTGNGELRTIEFAPPTPELLQEHFTNPAFLAGVGVFLFAMIMTLGSKAKLSSGDQYFSNWFLANGAITHVMMDGLTGGFHIYTTFDHNYRLLDNRANDDVPVSQGGPLPGDVAVAKVCFYWELFLMAPFCIWTYIAKKNGKAYANELAIITLVMQIGGTFLFVGPELLTGCPSMQPFHVDTCIPPDYSPFYLFYWYFAVGANAVWIVVPIYMIYRAIRQNVNARAGKQKTQ